jgi:hypothetical protein
MIDAPKKRSRKRKWLAGSFVALLVLYPLSTGPASRMPGVQDGFSRTAELYGGFYAPIFLVCDRVPFFERAMGWYMYLWSEPDCP